MATATPTKYALTAKQYDAAAQAYLQSLPLEHFMESTPQSTQRKITLESLDLLVARRPDVHVFSELLVQYHVPPKGRLRQVVPDNMVVLSDAAIEADGSYAVALQPAEPFWMLEYVSKHNQRKDYEDNFQRYEKELKTPYYLIFHPEKKVLALHHHTGRKYAAVKPNQHGRLEIPELDLEVGLLDGWVRFWHEGELLPLPADLERDLKDAKRRAVAAERRARQADDRARQADDRARQADETARALQQRLAAAEAELAELRARQGRPSTKPTNGRQSER